MQNFRVPKFSEMDIISPVCAGISVLIGASVLIGWALRIPTFTSSFPNAVTMNPFTAFGCLFAGTSLGLLRPLTDPRRRPAACAFALATTLIGLARIAGYFSILNFNFDLWLFRGGAGMLPMAAATAMDFVLIGIALLLLSCRTRIALSQFFALSAMLIALMTLLGYVYESRQFYSLIAASVMAPNTAMVFEILGFGILMKHKDLGLMKSLTNLGPAGFMARRLLPWAFILPIGIGWLRLEGERLNLYGPANGTVLSVVFSIVVLSALIWLLAHLLFQADEERKRLEAERERYARFFSPSVDLFCIISIDGFFKDLSPNWEQFLGYSIAELLERPYAEFIHPEDRPATSKEHAHIAQGGETFAFENRYRCKDGSDKWLLWNATFVPDTKLVYAVARDISARKQAERERILQSEKMVAMGQMAASVAHELNNPLAGILGYLQLLQDSDISEQQRGDLKVVETQANRCRDIIQNLLQFSRKKEPKREMLSLELVLDVILHLVQHDFMRAKIEIRKEIDASLPVVWGDGVQLQQVFLNLLMNAKHAMEGKDKAQLVIRGGQADGEVLLSFQDNGCGIARGNLERMFELFFTTKPVGKGTGLGLSISNGIIKEHGGKIIVASEEGNGTTFTIKLPISTRELEPV